MSLKFDWITIMMLGRYDEEEEEFGYPEQYKMEHKLKLVT